MLTWFQVAYLSAKLVQITTDGKRIIMTPIEMGDNEPEYCAGLDAYVDIGT